MAGRRGTDPRAHVLAQTPKVVDPQVQRALDVHHQAILDLQSRRHLELFTSIEDGYVPASGTDDNAVLHADGVWRLVGSGGSSGVSSVTGTAPITASPTTGAVIVSLNDNGVSNAKLRDSAGTSVIGRASNTLGDPADIVATADGQILTRVGGTLQWVAGPTGTGTTNRVAKWTSSSTLGNSRISDDGTEIVITSDRFYLDRGAGDGRLRFASVGNANYIQSGINGTGGSAAPLLFTTINAADEWMRLTAAGLLGIGTGSTVDSKLHVKAGASGASIIASTVLTVENSGDMAISIRGPSNNYKAIFFANPSSAADGGILYDDNANGFARGFEFRTGGNLNRLTITAAGLSTFTANADSNIELVNDTQQQTTANTSFKAFQIDATTASVQKETATALSHYGAHISVTPTRANSELGPFGDVTVYGAYLNASIAGIANGGTKTAYALYCDNGDVRLNASGGVTVISGATTIGNTLLVTGATTLQNTLAVTGAVTMSSTLAVDGNVTLGDGADSHIINGNVRQNQDNTHFSWDSGSTDRRVGFTKKAGFVGKITFGSANSLAFAQSSAAEIDAANTFTDKMVLSSTGLAVIAGTSTAAAAGAGTVVEVRQADATNNYLTFRGTAQMGLHMNSTVDSDGFVVFVTGTRSMVIGTAATTRMEIDSSGTVFFGDTTNTGIANNVDIISIGQTGTGQTSDGKASIRSTNTGSYDSTAAALTEYGIKASIAPTRSAGANTVTAIAAHFTATSATGVTPIGLFVTHGASSGLATALTGTVAVIENVNGTADYLQFRSNTTAGLAWAGSGTGGDGKLIYDQSINAMQFATANSFRGAILSTGKWQIGDTSGSAIDNNVDVLEIGNTGTGQTASTALINASHTGSFDATAATRTSIGALISITSTRSAGANSVTNKAISLDASGAQTNIAIETANGDNRFNVSGGKSTFFRNVELGDDSADTHTLNGNITFSNPPTAGSIKYGSLQARIFIKRQAFTSGGTYTPSTDAKAVLIRLVGGGGGGGGAGGGASVRSAGGGGSSGAYLEHWVDPSANITGGTVTIGSGGGGGTSSGGNGSNGGDTSVVVQGTTYTAKGGTGNLGQNTSTGYTQSVNPQSGSTSVDITSGGAGTAALMHGAGTNVIAGNGGSNPLGYGGVTPTDAAGVAGIGYGSGGSGGLHNGSTDRAGGAGAAGVVIIEEYA